MDFIEFAQKLNELKETKPSVTALSTPRHTENPEDGFITITDIGNGVQIATYMINTEPKQKGVQNLKFGDNLEVRRSDKKFAFDCGWRILQNVCVREAVPDKPGLQKLTIVSWGLETIEIEPGDDTIYHTVMRKRYNTIVAGNRGRCINKIKS
jgi:hypothetical protein